jgi:hypothetical protein
MTMETIDRNLVAALWWGIAMAAAICLAGLTAGANLLQVASLAVGGLLIGPVIYWRHFGDLNDQIRKARTSPESKPIRPSPRSAYISSLLMLTVVFAGFLVGRDSLELQHILTLIATISVLTTIWLLVYVYGATTPVGWFFRICGVVLSVAAIVGLTLVIARLFSV